MRLYLHYIYNT